MELAVAGFVAGWMCLSMAVHGGVEWWLAREYGAAMARRMGR